MYRFTTQNGQHARIDPTQVRSILPSGSHTGYVKLVLDGGHSVTVQGETEAVHDLLNQYRLHPSAPTGPSDSNPYTNKATDAGTFNVGQGVGTADEFSAWTARFAQDMTEALRRNAHKGGRENWLSAGSHPLAAALKVQFDALCAALTDPNASANNVWQHAANVANMAGMTADAYQNGVKGYPAK